MIANNTVVSKLLCHDLDEPPDTIHYAPGSGPIGSGQLFKQVPDAENCIQVSTAAASPGSFPRELESLHDHGWVLEIQQEGLWHSRGALASSAVLLEGTWASPLLSHCQLSFCPSRNKHKIINLLFSWGNASETKNCVLVLSETGACDSACFNDSLLALAVIAQLPLLPSRDLSLVEDGHNTWQKMWDSPISHDEILPHKKAFLLTLTFHRSLFQSVNPC